MATGTVSAQLNPEPSQPEERKTQDLEPKSYVDAVVSGPVESANGSVANDSSSPEEKIDVNGANGARAGVAESKSTASKLGASVLPTGTAGFQGTALDRSEEKDDESHEAGHASVTTTSNGGAVKGDARSAQQERPGIDRQESKHEYSATGLDESPRSAPRVKHKKSASQKLNSTDVPSTDTKDATIFEKFEDHANGVKLVSVKLASDQKKEQRRTDKEDPKSDSDSRTLVSGRQAGKRWERTPIRFAPMNVPLQRRLQTLVVLFHSTCIALGVSTFFFLCAIPIFWPLLIIYMIYCMSSNAATDGTLRRRSNLFRASPVWSLFASYFPARLHRSQELPPTRKYIFGYHPHGIISHGAFAAFGTEALGFSQLFPGITNTLLTLDSNFRIPIYRDYALAMGLGSVSRESCENLLSKGGKNNEGMGRAITIVVGGAAESLDAQPYSMRLVLARRKGFIKMALRTGADLVPVLAFGENDLYDQVTSNSHPSIHKVQLLVKKALGFTIPLFHARGVFNYDVGLMPYRRPLNVVVGRPIRVTQNVKPGQEEIDRLHELYVQELESIWESWKDDFARGRKGELEILE